jgi:NAD(P)-dependent dehydrogenase (short-subunit alcohol dehydrogenase family)
VSAVPDNPLDFDGANAVVAGGGALGTAFANILAGEPAIRSVTMLARTEPRDLHARVDVIPLEATEPGSVASAARDACARVGVIHLLINTVGMLHSENVRPEKRLRDLEAASLQQAIAINALFPALLAEGLSRALRHREPAMFASLSARVGSIGDNKLGGWYSYRASKAAHNMLLRTLSREWRVSHRNVTVVALHPGTVESRLSRPFVSDSYGHRVLPPEESAARLLEVMRGLSAADSGSFYDWRGDRIPW